MRAIIQTAYGSADVLQIGAVERPRIGPDEVLVEVRAAGVDRAVWHLMTGLPYVARLVFGIRSPKVAVPGFDVAGVVVEVGADVTRFQPGDEVFGIGKGTFAEFAAARADKLSRKPVALTFEQAAAVPMSGMTAIQGLADVGRLEAGQRVLVIGASGGVGTHAVQIAKAMGATVTGVASPAKLDLVRSIGADRVTDYTRQDFADGSERYDLILDTGGNTALRRVRAALTPRGTLVIVGGEGGGRVLGVGRQLRAVAWSPFLRQRLTMFTSRAHHDDLDRLCHLIESGNLVPSIDRVYPLEEAPEALRQLEAGQIAGKAVIGIRSGS
ncbi:MAG TPA: NAD(P)-dependent alcohol dehydrogenase [Acidimicrobiia bacterium]|nr:NAD(P)-dependent alcohol dehydrogenase [Acidimicrobiia bacterium]